MPLPDRPLSRLAMGVLQTALFALLHQMTACLAPLQVCDAQPYPFAAARGKALGPFAVNGSIAP